MRLLMSFRRWWAVIFFAILTLPTIGLIAPDLPAPLRTVAAPEARWWEDAARRLDPYINNVFGFRGARFTSVPELARGESDTTSDRQRGFDRYATSKLLNTVTAMELARRIPAGRTAFFTLDPGLMAGTGLARTAPAPVRLLWSTVLRWVSPLLPDTSTPERSAAAAAWLLTDPAVTSRSGEVFDYERKPSQRVWATARSEALGRRVLDETLQLLGETLPSP